MNVLVTGAAGYIGSVCTEVLLSRGHDVIAVDDLSEGHREAVAPGAIVCECALGNREALESVFSAHRIGAVMHFAARCLVEESVREPGLYYRINVAEGISLLETMARHDVRQIIFSSTAAVYGEPETALIPETHPTRPINPYGASKRLFEHMLEGFASSAGLKAVSLRYFNAAGASAEHGEDHRPETHIIPLLLEVAAGEREAFRIYGGDYPTSDGTCIRDYVHVLDIAEAHMLALEQLERIAGSVYNLGNSQGFSVLQVIEAARQIAGAEIPARIEPRRPGDPAVLVSYF
jgi:UDP-glucose 4-epimerase